MSRTEKFIVELEFDSKVTSDEDLGTIAQNIADSIKHIAGTSGISPDDADYYTQKIYVRPWYLNETKYTGFADTTDL